MTLTAPAKRLDQPLALSLEGHARIGEATLAHEVVASDDMMQAFLYEHLVPAQQFVVTSPKVRRMDVPPLQLARQLRIPTTGQVIMPIKTRKNPNLSKISFKLQDAPDGLILGEGLALMLKADMDPSKAGTAGNLLVEVFWESTPDPKKPQASGQKTIIPIGMLPAIAYEIVSPDAK